MVLIYNDKLWRIISIFCKDYKNTYALLIMHRVGVMV